MGLSLISEALVHVHVHCLPAAVAEKLSNISFIRRSSFSFFGKIADRIDIVFRYCAVCMKCAIAMINRVGKSESSARAAAAAAETAARPVRLILSVSSSTFRSVPAPLFTYCTFLHQKHQKHCSSAIDF